MKNLLLIFAFVSHLVIPDKMVANVHPDFETQCKKLKLLIERDQLDSAKLVLPLIDSLAKIHESPEVKADRDFYEAYYWLFRVGEVNSFELLTKAGLQYKTLGLQEKANLVEAYLCINLYFMGRDEDCAEKADQLLITIPEDQIEAHGLLHNILAARYGGADGNLERSVSHCHEAIRIFKTLKNYRRLNSLYGVLAANSNNHSNYQEALVYIDSAMYYATLLNNERQTNFLRIRKARSLLNMGMGEAAMRELVLAESFYRDFGSEHGELPWIYGIRIRYYVNKGDYKKAYDNVLMKDSIAAIVRARDNEKTLNDLMVKYETEKKEQQIKVQALTIENQEQRHRQLLTSSIGGAVLLLVLFGLGYLSFRNREKEKLRKAEIQYQKELLETTVNVQETVRKRIARDLHDGIGQQLSGLKLGFQQLAEHMNGNPGHQEHFQKLQQIVHDASVEARNLSHQMMPKALQELGLVSAMEDMLDKSFSNTSVQYEFDHLGMRKRLPENIEIGLYRISQELVNNILKHSGASEVDVQLSRRKEKIILMVEDNGKGFDPSQSGTNGQGLMNIRSRTQAIQGSIKWESNQPQGTLAMVSVPLFASKYHLSDA